MHAPLTRFRRVLAGTLGSSTTGLTAQSTDIAGRTSHSFTNGRKTSAAKRVGFEPLESRTLMSTTYYVSPLGSDSNAGTSQSAPWKSIGKADSTTFHAGDQILFQGGQSFNGNLQINNSGVTVASYGTGRATINAGGGNGIRLEMVSDVSVHDINVVGSGATHNSGTGVLVYNYSRTNSYSNDTVNNVDAGGFGQDGIGVFGGWKGFDNVRVTNVTSHDNANFGISFSGWYRHEHTNGYIGNSTVWNNPHSGINISSTDGMVVEHTVAYKNGAAGGLGFEAYWSSNVVFQYDIAHDNFTTWATDGGGFDFDWDTSNSVMQYNYAYNNDGHGFQLNQAHNDTTFTNDVIRYNVSSNNGLKHNYGGVGIWGPVRNSQVYGNTIYANASPNSGATPSGIRIHNSGLPGLYVYNLSISGNTLVSSGGVPLLSVTSAEISGATNMKFSGNTYWATGSFNISYGSTYTSLSSFESKTGQDSGAKMSPPPATPPVNSGAGLTSSPVVVTPPPVTTPVTTPPVTTPPVTTPPVTTPTTPSTPATAALTTTVGADIGAVGHGGYSTTSSSGKIAVVGSGAGLGGTSDHFHFSGTTVSGDTTLVAKVDSITNTSTSAGAGLIIRDGTASNAKEAAIMVSPAGVVSFEDRITTGGTASTVNLSGYTGAVWLKIVRAGSVFSGYASSNGTTWTLVSSAAISMNTSIDIGLAVTSHANSKKASGVFEQLSLTTTD